MEAMIKVGKLLKDAWLIVGNTVLLFCFLEGSLSLAFLITDRLRASDRLAGDRRVVADTYPDSAWVNNYYEEFSRSYSAQWKPYVYWRRTPYRGNYINVDTDGIRLTALAKPVQPIQRESRTPLKIFMFGGSTMWGTGARDAFTVPSILAQELQNKGVATEVTNFGESGYVSTQEIIALLLQLQKGQRPDLVIFYDGVNDVFSAYQQQVAGLPQNEFNRVREFNLSRAVKRKQRTDMVLQDVAMRLSTMRFVKGLIQKAHVRREAAVAANTFLADSLALQGETLVQDVVASYTGNIEVVKALGEHYHFKYLFYWQPTVFQKAHLTDYERVQAAAKMQTIEQFVRRTYEVIRQSTLAERRETSFHDLSLVFADLREPVYVDWSHLGESGNEIIARRMAGDVLGSIIANKEAAEHSAAPDGDSAALHRRR